MVTQLPLGFSQTGKHQIGLWIQRQCLAIGPQGVLGFVQLQMRIAQIQHGVEHLGGDPGSGLKRLLGTLRMFFFGVRRGGDSSQLNVDQTQELMRLRIPRLEFEEPLTMVLGLMPLLLLNALVNLAG